MKIRPKQIAAENGRLLVLDHKERIWEHLTEVGGDSDGRWGQVNLPDEPDRPPHERKVRRLPRKEERVNCNSAVPLIVSGG